MKYTFFQKIKIAKKVFYNWPLIILDRLGLIKEVTYRTRLGPIFRCRGGESDSGTIAVIFSGIEYPVDIIEFNNFRDNANVWDLGANIGTFSIWSSLHLKNKFQLLCVEPFSENISYLRTNLELNNISSFNCFEGVVSNFTGFVNIDVSRKADAVKITTNATNTKVKSITLQDLAELYKTDRVDLLKMDIEGAEYSVINHSLDYLANNVERIIIEVHGKEKGLKNPLVSLLKNYFSVALVAENILFFKSIKTFD